MLIPIAGEIVHGQCSQALRPCIAPLAVSCWANLSKHHTVIAHHSSLLGHPLSLDVQDVLSSFQAIEVDAWMGKIPHGGLVRAWVMARVTPVKSGSDCRLVDVV